MGKTATTKRRHLMAKRTDIQQKRHQRVLTLKVAGQIRPGTIAIPDLLVICEQVQSAVSRQAEALEGKQTLRPGRKLEKVRVECTLELAALRSGSPTTALGFDFTKPQQSLPIAATFGEDVLAKVVGAIESIAEGRSEDVDPGVLDSLNSMGEVFDRKIKSVKWIMPSAHGRKRREVVFDQKVRRRVAERLKPPSNQHMEVEGIVEMADFKATDQRCRVLPVFGPPILCAFDESHANEIQVVMRKPAKIVGEATINAQTGKLETIQIEAVTPLDPLALGASHFFAGLTLDQLAKLQAVEPLQDISVLSGGWPDDEDVDAAMDEIYRHREQ